MIPVWLIIGLIFIDCFLGIPVVVRLERLHSFSKTKVLVVGIIFVNSFLALLGIAYFVAQILEPLELRQFIFRLAFFALVIVYGFWEIYILKEIKDA